MKDKQEIINIIEKLKEKLCGIRLLFECLSTASINGMAWTAKVSAFQSDAF